MKATNLCVSALTLTLIAGAATAEPISGTYFDLPNCDNHGPQQAEEEFGDPLVFAPDEAILHSWMPTQAVACPMTDNTAMPNAMVEITNLTGRFLDNLYYVGDVDTGFSNFDGAAFGAGTPGVVGQAFRIDTLGVNRNLAFESVTFDGILEPGETWRFIVQDYTNAAGVSPDSFFSIGMAGDSLAHPGSSASIVRMVPTPASSLLALAGLAMLRRRR